MVYFVSGSKLDMRLVFVGLCHLGRLVVCTLSSLGVSDLRMYHLHRVFQAVRAQIMHAFWPPCIGGDSRASPRTGPPESKQQKVEFDVVLIPPKVNRVVYRARCQSSR